MAELRFCCGKTLAIEVDEWRTTLGTSSVSNLRKPEHNVPGRSALPAFELLKLVKQASRDSRRGTSGMEAKDAVPRDLNSDQHSNVGR
jgi:hypothetical protein